MKALVIIAVAALAACSDYQPQSKEAQTFLKVCEGMKYYGRSDPKEDCRKQAEFIDRRVKAGMPAY